MKKYELIKKLPFEGSPEIGYISRPKNNVGDHYWSGNWFKPNEYPEFWEEIVEKDYEILSFKDSINSVLQKRKDNKFQSYTLNSFTEQQLLNNQCRIHSVKRISDGEVFTIGDKVHPTQPILNDTIREFTIGPNGYIYVKSVKNKWGAYLSCLVKSKQPLFTIEDGVNVFEGDNLWCVKIYHEEFVNNHDKVYSVIKFQGDINKRIKSDNYKWFSTKEKAEEYILLNKPCLSINDINKNWVIQEGPGSFRFVHGNNTIKNLKELVKQRMK